jgi:hypothetical protein
MGHTSSFQGLLPDYLRTLPINFHQTLVHDLKRAIEDANTARQTPGSKITILLLTGKSGTGKTFSVYRACQEAGFQLYEPDDASLDFAAEMRAAVTCPPRHAEVGHDKKLRVALFDNIDFYSTPLLNQLRNYLTTLSTGRLSRSEAVRGKSTRRAVHIATNVVILVCSNENSQPVNALVKSVKPRKLVCYPPGNLYIQDLMRLSCEHMGLQPHLLAHNFPSVLEAYGSEDLTSLFMNFQFLLTDPQGAHLLANAKKDLLTVNFFNCVKYVMAPPDTAKFAEYQRQWQLGGDGVARILFNSYPKYLPYVTQTPSEITAWLSLGHQGADPGSRPATRIQQAHTGGLESMAALAEAFSSIDLIQGGFSMDTKANDEDRETVHLGDSGSLALQLTSFCVLSNVFVRSTKNPQPDFRTQTPRPPYNVLQSCLLGCRSQQEKLHYVEVMRQIELRKKCDDFQYVTNPNYELTEHVGKYMTLYDVKENLWLQKDLFQADQALLNMSRKNVTKTTGVYDERKIPNDKLQAIRVFSHVYSK